MEIFFDETPRFFDGEGKFNISLLFATFEVDKKSQMNANSLKKDVNGRGTEKHN
jgi:hypothetical protein